jgi:hypothetical protein
MDTDPIAAAHYADVEVDKLTPVVLRKDLLASLCVLPHAREGVLDFA